MSDRGTRAGGVTQPAADRPGNPAAWGGYTLLELMAVIAVVLVGGVAVVAGVGSVRKASLSTSAARVAAAVRYLYDLSVLNNRPYRLVVDLDGRSFWGEPVEDACGGALLPSDEERRFGVESRAVPVEDGGPFSARGERGERAREGVPLARPIEGGPMPAGNAMEPGVPPGDGPRADGATPRRRIRPKENLLTRQVLPEGISFGAVMTSHHDEPVEEGEAEVFFFPDGYAEKALIYLKKGEETYTIETVPLKGVGVVHPEELDPRLAMEGR